MVKDQGMKAKEKKKKQCEGIKKWLRMNRQVCVSCVNPRVIAGEQQKGRKVGNGAPVRV